MSLTALPLRAVVFDLDGTLLDTAPDFVFVLNRLREEEGLPPLDPTLIRNTVSDGARALVTLGFELQEEDEGFEPLRLRLLELYSEHLAVKSGLFPGIAGLLEFLQQKGLAWGIATNKPELYTTPLLAALGLQPDCVICPDHVSERKPHAESLLLASRLLACEPQQILYVGDHQRDIACGINAGSPTVAAAYGYVHQDDDVSLWQADHIVHQPEDLLPLVRQYIGA